MRVPFPMIDGQMLDDMLERGGDFLLVDLRSEREYAAGRLRGAVNIPCSRLRAEYCGLPRDRLVVFYCGRGSNSLLACSRLAPWGFGWPTWPEVSPATGENFWKRARERREMLTEAGGRTYNGSESTKSGECL